MSKDKDKLRLWQDRLSTNESAYQPELDKMEKREKLYQGDRKLKQIVRGERKTEAVHVRNIVAELIESQVDSAIPQPKVTARYKRDERLAKIIEDMLRNEMDRLPIEMMNDLQERTVPLQGHGFFNVEWDNTKRTHTTVGELTVSLLHPRQVIPQDGVYTGIEDMDYVILKVPQTKAYIRRRYGVDVSDESESEADIKGSAHSDAADMVTQYIAYYRNDKGGIGKYSWVNDVQLEDMEDYQARRLRRCKKCGMTEDAEIQPMEPTPDGTAPEEEKPKRKGVCPYCGSSSWESSEEQYETLARDIVRSDGSVIPAFEEESAQVLDEYGMPQIDPFTGAPMTQLTREPTKIPFYKPDVYPVLQRKNVSVYGMFGGDSDVDKIADQQNTINRLSSKIIDKLLKSGSYMTLPDDCCIEVDAEDMKVIRPGDPAKKALIDVFDLQGNTAPDLEYMNEVYEEARQIIGVTDSFQGRNDPTATSGKAKEFAAAQSAGRLESKRRMKDAAYAALYEAMFKFKLAYTDEPRPVVSQDNHGQNVYEEFNKYDFLERDAAGEWYWNDQFLFSCDTSATLAGNREAMWQETRQNFQSGAFGDPAQADTLILFWTKMALLHYPGAEDTLDYLKELQQQQQQQQEQQMQMQQQQQQMQMQAQQQQMQQQQQMAQQQRAEAQQMQRAKMAMDQQKLALQKQAQDAKLAQQMAQMRRADMADQRDAQANRLALIQKLREGGNGNGERV